MTPWARTGRVAWRLVVFAVSFVLMQGIAESLLAPVGGWLARRLHRPVLIYPWSELAGALGACAVSLRLVLDRAWEAVGLGEGAWAPRRVAWGAAIGAGAIAVTAAGLFAAGALRFEAPGAAGSVMGAASPDGWGRTALLLTLVLAPAALWEEVVFRGYLYDVAAEAGGARVARYASSTAFALVHAANPGAGLLPLAAVWLAGWGLALVRERTGSLPAAWVAHLAWNWIMAVVLHVPVSGLAFDTPAYRAVLQGPAWLTGGGWGPEGGVVALLVMGAGAWLGRPRPGADLSTALLGGS